MLSGAILTIIPSVAMLIVIMAGVVAPLKDIEQRNNPAWESA
jgi:hypothetical protein